MHVPSRTAICGGALLTIAYSDSHTLAHYAQPFCCLLMGKGSDTMARSIAMHKLGQPAPMHRIPGQQPPHRLHVLKCTYRDKQNDHNPID